ncbi:MAG: ChaB family protein [Defluviicoccus sp.]
MPYSKKSELSEPVQDTLPAHAQEIFKAAYNSAWEQYDKPSKRRGKASREETSMKVAWAAVKKKYEKRDGEWVAKEE